MDMLHLLLNEEINDAIKGITGGNISEKGLTVDEKKGNFFVPISSKISHENLSSFYRDTIGDLFLELGDAPSSLNLISESNFFDFIGYYDKISNEVKTITASPAKALMVIQSLIRDAGDIFAGALMIDPENSSWVINPTHPLVVERILAGQIKLPSKVKVLLFTYKTSKTLDEEVYEYISKQQALVIKIARDFSQDSLKRKVDIRDINGEEELGDLYCPALMDVEIEYNVEVDGLTKVIVPYQLLTRGEMIPYFGTGIIQASGVGRTLPGHLSGNVKFGYYNSGGVEGVCTGDYSNRTPEGWLTLNRVNLNSVWYDYMINYEYYSINKAYMDLAADLIDALFEGGSDE